MFTLLETCLQGTAMPLVLLAVRPCLRRHVPSRVLRALWIVAFVWLLLPVRLSLPDVPHLTVTLPAVTAVVDFGELGGAALPVIVDATSLATPNDAAACIPLLDGLLAAQAVLGARLGTVAVSYSLGPVPIGPILLVGMCGAAACLLYLSLTSLFTHRRLLKMPQLRRPEMDAWSRGHRLRRPLLVCRVPQTAPHAPGTSVTSGFLYPVIAVPDDEVSRFGIIGGTRIGSLAGAEGVADVEPGAVWEVTSMVEKPALQDAPSHLAIFGRYLLSAGVMRLLATQEPGKGNEVQLTDAMVRSLAEEKMYAVVIDPTDGHDTGTIPNLVAAGVRMGLRDPRYADSLREALADVLRPEA